jgi:hypothetical protein
MTNTSSKQLTGILFLIVGVVLSTTLTAAQTWANFEADFYGFQRYTSDRFRGLSCPVFLTSQETGNIVVEIKNTTNKPINPVVRIDTSTATVPETIDTRMQLAPGETQYFSQTVMAANVDLGFFIFAKAFRYPSIPLAAAETTCGIMFFDLPVLSGGQVYLLWLLLSMVCVPLGLWFWSPGADEKLVSAARFMVVVSLGGLLLSSSLGWGFGVLSLMLTLLSFTVILRQAVVK